MKKTFKELKREARAALKGKWGEGVLLVFVLLLFAFLCDLPSGYYQISHPGYQQDMMNYGIQWSFLKFVIPTSLLGIFVFYPLAVGASNSWRVILDGDKNLVDNAFKLGFGNYFHNIGGMLLRSQELMKGNKWRYFLLALSFLGWILLGILSLGIGFFWIIPYIETTTAAFYYDIKAQKGL